MSTSLPAENGVAILDGQSVSMESHSSMVIVITAILTSASIIVFSLRLFTRTYLLKTAGLDDWTMLVAQILAIFTGVSTIVEARAGLGRHIETLSPESIRESLIGLYLSIITYNMGLNVVKMSFLLQYRRIFPSPTLRRICSWALGFVGIWMVAQQILLTLSCVPLANLEPSAAPWCLNTLPIWEFTSIVSLVTDFMIFVIPLPYIWELPTPLRQKLVLFGVFGLGFCVCVISIVRVPTLRAAASAEDPTFDNIRAALFTVAEYNAAIICSSLPILRPLFFRVSGHLTYGKKSYSSGADLVESNAHRMQKLKSNKVTAKDTEIELGREDSSEDLATATFDEMMYGSRSRHSVGGRPRTTESARPSTTLSGGGSSFVENGPVDLRLSPRPL